MPQFARYIGIDYSGAQDSDTPLKGLRVYVATVEAPPVEVLPRAASRYWTRRGLAEWLTGELESAPPTLVGLDHGFSFPLAYFERHCLPLDWAAFLVDFQQQWPTQEESMSVKMIRTRNLITGTGRDGDPKWRRVTERRCRGAKSVFHFDVPGSVAMSTHAGLPWLLRLRQEFGPRLHCWPFAGWSPPAGRHVIAEIYPVLWSRRYPVEDRTSDQHDAYATARWLRETDAADHLPVYWQPNLTAEDQATAAVEGWILGVE